MWSKDSSFAHLEILIKLNDGLVSWRDLRGALLVLTVLSASELGGISRLIDQLLKSNFISDILKMPLTLVTGIFCLLRSKMGTQIGAVD